MQAHFRGGPLDGAVWHWKGLDRQRVELLERCLDDNGPLEIVLGGRSHVYRHEGPPGELDSLMPSAMYLYYQGVR